MCPDFKFVKIFISVLLYAVFLGIFLLLWCRTLSYEAWEVAWEVAENVSSLDTLTSSPVSQLCGPHSLPGPFMERHLQYRE